MKAILNCTYFEPEPVTIKEERKEKESEGEKTMSGYSYFDKQNGKLFTISAILDGYYPPKFNFNISTFVNGKIDKNGNKSWSPIKLANLNAIIANLTDPNTYGPLNIQEGKLEIYVGLGNDGTSFTSGTDGKYQTLMLSQEGKEHLIHYLQVWLQFGTFAKDLFDNITDKVAKDTENMLKDFAKKIGYNIDSLDRFGNGNTYVSKKNYTQPSQPKQSVPSYPNVPQMPIPGATTAVPVPPPPVTVTMGSQMPVPPVPPKPPVGGVPSAPSVQQPPKMPPNMGMSIPQTPGASGDFGSQLNEMLKSAFNN